MGIFKKISNFGSVKMTTEVARAHAERRAKEQRQLVIHAIEKQFFTDMMDPCHHGHSWTEIYGYEPWPVVIAPATMTNANFEYPNPRINATTGLVEAGGGTGLQSISLIGALPTTTQTGPFGPGSPDNQKEFVIAKYSIGVGSDYYFDKPSYARGDIFSSRIRGYLRFRTNMTPESIANSGYWDSGVIQFRVVNAGDEVEAVILECAIEKFNAASKERGIFPPQVSIDLDSALYPNWTKPVLLSAGSTLEVVVKNLGDNGMICNLDNGAKFDMAATPEAIYIDGPASCIDIETHRLIYVHGYNL